jgi:hypothetical protein
MTFDIAGNAPWYELRAIARDGAQTDCGFSVRSAAPLVEDRLPFWNVWVMPVEHSREVSAPYYAKIVKRAVNTVWSKTVENNLPDQYHRRGITPALYVALAAFFQMRLCSSLLHPGPADYLTVDTHAIWEGLVKSGLAIFDPNTDRYWIEGAGRPIPTEIALA